MPYKPKEVDRASKGRGMKTEMFQEKLAATGDEGLYPGVTKYQHVERLGSSAVVGLLDKPPIVIQEKIDGANLTVAYTENGIAIFSRQRLLSLDGKPDTGFRGAVEYVLGHEGIKKFLFKNPQYILRGEWLVHHTIVYPDSAWNKFYVFDVQDVTDGSYVPVWGYGPILNSYDIEMVPLVNVYVDAVPDNAELFKMADRNSALGDPSNPMKAEGIVIKNYDFLNKYGRTQWAKIVPQNIDEVRKAAMGATKKDLPEIKFVAKHVTQDLINKTIAKIRNDADRGLEPRDIPRVLNTVWHDAFIEELWTFVKKDKTRVFDFNVARKLCYDKVRGKVLAYLSGSN